MKECYYAGKPKPVESACGRCISHYVVLCDRDNRYATPQDCAKCRKREER